ncbi:hypothetical protein KSP40_PGU013425 [Platanthera guangdongensis]|uniref:Uncharacterized protein n=1 Tax=Platanthera guangdongensis TaxID=2320717 RepID=A0ABR2LVW0_9ASPA
MSLPRFICFGVFTPVAGANAVCRAEKTNGRPVVCGVSSRSKEKYTKCINMITGAAQKDGGFLVVSAPDEPIRQTKEHILVDSKGDGGMRRQQICSRRRWHNVEEGKGSGLETERATASVADVCIDGSVMEARLRLQKREKIKSDVYRKREL